MVGRKNLEDRCKGLISREEYKKRRLSSIYSIGTAKPYKGNQKFRIDKDKRSIIFQPNRYVHFKFDFLSIAKNYVKIIEKLFIRQEAKDLPITYKLNSEYVYISFEEEILYKDDFKFRKIKDRYMSLDLNPNYIGYSIIDWKDSSNFRVIHSGVYSFKFLNNLYSDEKLSSEDKKLKYKSNKKNYEIIQVARNLIKKCCYFKVENFIYLPIMAFGSACSTFISQNFGASKPERMQQGTRIALIMGITTTLATSWITLLLAKQLFGLFVTDSEVVVLGVKIGWITFPFYFVYVFLEIFASTIRGAGKALPAMIIIVVNMCLIRTAVLILMMHRNPTVTGVAIVYLNKSKLWDLWRNPNLNKI